MKPTRKKLRNMYAKNMVDILALRFALRDKLSMLDIYRNEASGTHNHQDIYDLDDMNELKKLLIRLIYESLNRKNLDTTKEKIRKMVRAILFTNKAEASLCPCRGLYLAFLYDLRSLITEGFLYHLRNSVVCRELRELRELS